MFQAESVTSRLCPHGCEDTMKLSPGQVSCDDTNEIAVHPCVLSALERTICQWKTWSKRRLK